MIIIALDAFVSHWVCWARENFKHATAGSEENSRVTLANPLIIHSGNIGNRVEKINDTVILHEFLPFIS